MGINAMHGTGVAFAATMAQRFGSMGLSTLVCSSLFGWKHYRPVFPLQAYQRADLAKHRCSQDAIVGVGARRAGLAAGPKQHAGSREERL